MTMQARAVQTRQTIVRAAADAFVRHGYSGASLAEIAAQAGVTKGALYFHFPSKAALAAAMIQTQREANEELERQIADHRADHLELLVELTHGLARRLVDDPTLQAAMRLAVELGETKDALIAETYQAWERLVADVAATAKQRGELAAGVDPAELARFLVAAFTGLQTVSLVTSALDDLDRRVAEMWRLLRPGLVPG